MSTGPLDLVTVGSAVIDYIHRVTVLPERDTGVMVLDRQSGPGGVDGNVAAAAARLDCPSESSFGSAPTPLGRWCSETFGSVALMSCGSRSVVRMTPRTPLSLLTDTAIVAWSPAGKACGA